MDITKWNTKQATAQFALYKANKLQGNMSLYCVLFQTHQQCCCTCLLEATSSNDGWSSTTSHRLPEFTQC
jgi:hypothetical protein